MENKPFYDITCNKGREGRQPCCAKAPFATHRKIFRFIQQLLFRLKYVLEVATL
ncbi:MAG: hypothetical protein FWE64_01245 [Alphaproteobacteria bacterium]|nr:hypothetical protein [Alphaproteobacteria bacterium]